MQLIILLNFTIIFNKLLNIYLKINNFILHTKICQTRKQSFIYFHSFILGTMLEFNQNYIIKHTNNQYKLYFMI